MRSIQSAPLCVRPVLWALCLGLCVVLGSPSSLVGAQIDTQSSEDNQPPAQAAPSEPAEEILTISTRPGVTERVLVTPPAQGDPTALLLLFPGGNGDGQFSVRDGQIQLGSNFLVRSIPLFSAAGLVTADVGLPSDQPNGVSVQFRASDAHTEDVSHIIAELRQRWALPVVLVGTSDGAISAAHLALSLPAGLVQRLVLTSSVGQRLGPRATGVRVSSLPIEQIRVPTLFIHHRDDGCSESQYADALALRSRMTGTPTAFVTVVGGDPPQSDPCEALSAHGFLGKEQDVVTVIAAWLGGGVVPDSIGP